MRVLYVQYTSPGLYPPLVRGAQLLAGSGADVRMLGTRMAGTDALDVPPAPRLAVRLMPPAAPGWRLKAHYARYATWVAREAIAWKPDWIYASDVLATPIALALSRLTRARVLYHEHDAPSDDRRTWMVSRCLAARQRLVREADVVVAPNAARAVNLSRLADGRAVLTVWNCPRRPDRSAAVASRPSADSLRVVYRGSINAERVPATIVEAIARARCRVTLDIAGYETVGSRGYVAALVAAATRAGVADRVRVLGTIMEAAFSELCEGVDLGLALMPPASRDENMRHMTGASNKVFEYLSYGVTPVVSDLPDWRATFVAPGYALACDPRDASSIASVFEWARAHRDVVRDMAARGRARILSDWNYETQFAPVMRAMWEPVAGLAGTPNAGAAQCAS